jgi:hypothetical protein
MCTIARAEGKVNHFRSESTLYSQFYSHQSTVNAFLVDFDLGADEDN